MGKVEGAARAGQPAATRWGAVLAIVGAGVVASLQVGKVIIAAPLLRRDLGLDLASIGTLTAVFSILGMVGGIAAGGIIARFGARRMLLWGLATVAAGTAAGALAPGYGVLLASRVVEGLGFLLITVAGPAALQRLVLPSSRDLAFALWSCYMPAGMAIAMLASQAFGDWHAYWWCAGATAVIALGCIAALAPPVPGGAALSWNGLRRDTTDTLGAAGPMLLAASFTLYSLMFFALFTFLPVLLMDKLGLPLATAGLYSAVASAANIIGNLGAGVLLSRGWRRSTLIACASVAMGVVALLIFQSVFAAMPTFLLCVLFSAVGGLIPATLLGTAPLVAPRPALTAATVGLVMMGSNLGQVIGPVTVGGVIDRYGWAQASLIVAAAALGGVTIAWRLRRLNGAQL
ncbi:CynX/NimT family MFS transporter [Achromobacter xylosoxidans]|uniref:MFS transporter n=1 Tax=Alcaligenes xylosoxydans xylosoxydans TaxID=85698 RepID=UPI0003322D50|nr:MFS transporter [Achromobacter xylosoxidans]MCH4592639.1 MFS transporter [Achromobacter xylosoxidans]CCH09042.1 major facilitator superfamily MFS_1 [Achromobacter xylosoxidans NH44784-1996]CUI54910.1 putative 3-hydroxyphenylpropionic transporter MhpT [Achromobacter xylosoxidans]